MAGFKFGLNRPVARHRTPPWPSALHQRVTTRGRRFSGVALRCVCGGGLVHDEDGAPGLMGDPFADAPELRGHRGGRASRRRRGLLLGAFDECSDRMLGIPGVDTCLPRRSLAGPIRRQSRRRPRRLRRVVRELVRRRDRGERGGGAVEAEDEASAGFQLRPACGRAISTEQVPSCKSSVAVSPMTIPRKRLLCRPPSASSVASVSSRACRRTGRGSPLATRTVE